MDNKITFDDFIARALKRKSEKKMQADIEVNGYCTLTFNRPTENQYLAYINGVSNAIKTDAKGNEIEQDIEKILETSKQLVYDTCEFLHTQGVCEQLNVIDPLDLVNTVFELDEIMELATKIMDAFKNVSEVGELVKN